MNDRKFLRGLMIFYLILVACEVITNIVSRATWDGWDIYNAIMPMICSYMLGKDVDEESIDTEKEKELE
jgi:hypothetical protein